jgi:hypothetical protein
MRLLEAPSTLLSIVAILLANSRPVTAGPFSRLNDLVPQEVEKLSHDDDALSLQNSTLELTRRGSCASGSFACGYYGQVCCVSGSQTCATNAQDQAYCADVSGGTGSVTTTAAGGSGSWQTYTSIWTTTGAITMTSIYSTYIPATVTGVASGNCVPNYANNESGCGPICCSSGQYCIDEYSGICKPAGNGGFTTTGVAGTTNSPPTRATTSNGVVITLTMTPTTTLAYGTPIPTGQNGTLVASHSGGGGLSGGAIAGIVIGVIAGIILLILICLCCCLKAGFDGLLALLGIGKKKDKRRRVVEETFIDEHRRYGSAAGSSRRWYGAGGRPGRPPPPPKEKKSGIGNLGAIGLGLGGLAVALGLKRRHDRKHDEKSDVSSSYYDSYYYSSSSK